MVRLAMTKPNGVSTRPQAIDALAVEQVHVPLQATAVQGEVAVHGVLAVALIRNSDIGH